MKNKNYTRILYNQMLNAGAAVLLCVFLICRTTVIQAGYILKLDNPIYAAFSVRASNIHKVSVKDTLIYLRSIVAKKTSYIGKPFSTLLSDLQIQIKFFSPVGSPAYDTSKETRTVFSFYFPQSADEIYLAYPYLRISWESYLNANTSHYLYNKNDGGGWTQEVINFYSTAIIKDMDILK